MSGDRTVHAEAPGLELVRYDRAGKWYLEPTEFGVRMPLTIATAARWAQHAERIGGRVFLGQPGGSRFDRLVAAPPSSPGGER